MNDNANVPLDLVDFNQPASLIYGIGNIGRQDDGLGWAVIDWIEKQGLCPQAQLNKHYQLQLEDADLISNMQRVLFIDASKAPDLNDFAVTKPQPNMDMSFTSHALSVATVMAVCQQCFQTLPQVTVLAIKGYEWELAQGLTPAAQINLEKACAFLTAGKAQLPEAISK